MDRVAIFVDAGYLFAQGSRLLTGTKQNREFLSLDIPATVSALKSAAAKVTASPLLRIYWYDGLRLGRPSREQTDLADCADIKIRLGQINTIGQQKGVDALIVTDLIDLARNHAMADAVLVSGDEDVRIGAQLAQQFGVRVHLIGIEPARSNQSRSLQQEADTRAEWDRATIASILAYAPPVAASAAASTEAAAVSVDEQVRAVIAALEADRAAEIRTGLMSSPKIPADIDRDLLRLGRLHHGRESLTQEERTELRAIFARLIKA